MCKNKLLFVLLVLILSINVNALFAQCGGCRHHGEHSSEKEMTPPCAEKRIEVEKKVIAVAESRGYLGVVTDEDDGKLVVRSVRQNSPAQIAGIKPGDIILEVNGIPMESPDDLIQFMQKTKPNEVIRVRLLSSDGEKTVEVKLGEVPKSTMKIKAKIKTDKESYGAGYFGPGLIFFNYDALNSVLANNRIARAQNSQFVFGGGGWGQLGKVRLGGWGVGGAQSVNSDSVYVELSYGVGLFELGYCFLNTPIKITPLIGIGGGGTTLKIKSRVYTPLTLNDVFSSPGGIAKISKGGLTLFSGLALDIPISFVGLSLKGGYLLNPVQSAWILEDFDEIKGPQFNPKGPFVSVSIMFGCIGKHR